MLPSDQFCRISHSFTGVGAPTGAAVVYCVRVGSSQPVLETAEVCHESFGTLVVNLLSSDVTLSETLAKEGPDNTGASALVTSPPYPGTSGSNSGAPQSALLVQKNTVLGGRRGRGRMYLPGLDESVVLEGGVVESSYLTAMQAALDAFYDDLGSSALTLALEHGPETTWVLVGGQPRRVPVAGAVPDPTDITSLVLTSRIGTQRRRNRR
jgi:hypothetical protein